VVLAASINTVRRSKPSIADHSLSRRTGRTAARTSPLASCNESPQGVPMSSSLKAVASSVPASSRPIVQSSEPIESHFVPPDASVVYQRRLMEGNFQSMFELLHAPYAPHALHVLKDMVQLVFCPASSPPSALSLSPRHIERLYATVLRGVSQALEESDLIEDKQSQQRVRQAFREVQSMQGFLEANMDQWERDGLFDAPTPAVGNTAQSPHSAIVFSVLRHQLRATSSLGMVEASVFNLQTMRRLHQPCVDDTLHDEDNSSVLDLADVVAVATSSALGAGDNMTVTIEDDLLAIISCRRTRNFDVALALFRQMTTDALGKTNAVAKAALTPSLLSDAMGALAGCVKNTEDFRTLRKVLVDSDMRAIPVSVKLYTSLIEAASRAVGDPERLSFALSLYRQMRDLRLFPSPETYTALMAVTASLGEPTQTFAFYREALALRGKEDLSLFPPQLFANLIEGYASAGQYDDARKTLEVLLEGAAPLNRAAFHAVLSVAPTIRDAHEVHRLMEAGVGGVTLESTPTTYAHILRAEVKHPRGISTILEAYDVHSKCMESVESIYGDAVQQEGKRSAALEDHLVNHEGAYCRALEDVCLSVPIDFKKDARVRKYVGPLISVAQKDATHFVTFAPQQPTKLPFGSTVVVLAADILASLEEFMIPSTAYFSSMVIPYSSVALFRRGSSRQGHFGAPTGKVSPNTVDDVSAELIKSRSSELRKFLCEYHSVTHIMSLEEELACSGDVARYGIPVGRLAARPAAIALNLARGISTAPVYHQQQCRVVLATTKFAECGRFVKDQERRFKHEFGVSVSLWNPKFRPHWRDQGSVSAEQLLVHEVALQQSKQQHQQPNLGLLESKVPPHASVDQSATDAERLMELLSEIN
jgi:tetratricopeptide (TPR) repeat protein